MQAVNMRTTQQDTVGMQHPHLSQQGQARRLSSSAQQGQVKPADSSTPDSGHARAQAPLLAHAVLHHPHAWPRQETALGLLISLRKFFATEWVRLCPPDTIAPVDVLLTRQSQVIKYWQ